MKLNCGPTYQERRQAKLQWHRKFVWFPKRVGDRDCRWLEYVERKGTETLCGWDINIEWEYRPIK